MMAARIRSALAAAGLLTAALILGGCSLEHIGDPWTNPGQSELLADELDRDAELTAELRDRLAEGQRDR